ncbi:MAG: hypothetical protein ACE5HX_18480, partial [bacterium]
ICSYSRNLDFKFRGAYNAMCQLTDEERQRAVITHSSGNHAQAVVLVGRLLGTETNKIIFISGFLLQTNWCGYFLNFLFLSFPIKAG